MSVSNVITESTSRPNGSARATAMRSLRPPARSSLERGFEATTIAEIAEAADLGFGTFYRYFPDKEAVLEAVLERR